MTEELQNALELRHVTRSFGDFTLRDVNLTLPSGCILGLIGENGAGKSTTIRLIMNTLRRDSGQIQVLGRDNLSPDFRETREDVGVVLDEAYFPEVLTAAQVAKVMANTYRRWDSLLFARYLQQFSLPSGKMFRDFSRGMKMKLAIAVALSHQPRLLILDEATSGLDPIVRDDILDIFLEFTRDPAHSILISSHILSDLEKICDYVAFLHQGSLLFCEEKDRLLETYGVVTCGPAQLAGLPKDAVVRVERSGYGVRALVRREKLPAAIQAERASMEDIILFLVKGEAAQ
ncbi:MAG: ABC transporter ATP-binding protein [Oscillibacter sp.]|jgi:ABC-2 type transport system ATP-binding protein|nr:ABC transporter ATP-binding protein [Oscillibacter sp.]